jgi:glycosyltransferase involved in cell wall biosynthesis
LVVPAGDEAALAAAILRLAGDRLLRQTLGAAAQAGYKRLFSPSAMAEAYLRLYR